ncbi:DUF2490 domain-containing protein [Chryseobacterium sp.]|uniref:DUF2490 domain-containing protein n=1 Tax=Chryseobacterium sp. TaxID=1871047 RepID=UPI00388E57C5
MKNYFLTLLIFISTTSSFFAQLSPPGLGDTNTASWFAVGVRQDLGNSKKMESLTYLGLGIKSNDDNDNFIEKPAIIVLNQEFYHRLNSHFNISYAASYRRQLQYSLDEYFNDQKSETEQELRLYGRLAYSTEIGKVKLTQTIRQEFRKFIDEKGHNADEPFQLRSRFKSQAAYELDQKNQHTIMAGAEVLFSTAKNNATKDWSKFGYQESRFTLFYTYRPQKIPIAISIGYMNNLIQKNKTHSVHYASLDLVWENPFSSPSKK